MSHRVNQLGEFGLIALIKDRFGGLLPKDVLGIGDDCALIPKNSTQSYAVTTDLLHEGTHFILSQTTGENLGYKALAVNLSDLAAMGAVPEFVTLSLSLPTSVESNWLDDFLRGFHDLCQKSGCALIGGDTTRASHDLVISVTAIGTLSTQKAKLRSLAKPGDVICVTKTLGDSAAGLELLCGPHCDRFMTLVERHRRPQPEINKGQWLGQFTEVTTMMDLSDGLNSDLRRILEASKVGAKISLEHLPASLEMLSYCKEFSKNPREFMVYGGEDYGLLLTINQTGIQRIQSQYKAQFGSELVAIGEITSQAGDLSYLEEGISTTVPGRSFEHF